MSATSEEQDAEAVLKAKGITVLIQAKDDQPPSYREVKSPSFIRVVSMTGSPKKDHTRTSISKIVHSFKAGASEHELTPAGGVDFTTF
jgi:hypothetical protein